MFAQPSKFSAVITKRVDCEQCGTRYLYELSREASAHSYALLLITIGLVPLVPLSLLTPGGGWVIFLLPVAGIGLMLLYRLRGAASGDAVTPLPGVSVALDNSAQNDAGMAVGARLRRTLEEAVEPVACPECGWYQRDMVTEARARVFPWFDRVALGIVLMIQAVAVGVIKNRHMTESGDMIKLWGICTGVGLGCAGIAYLVRWLLAFSYNPNHGYPAPRPPYPEAPAAIRESEYLAKIAAETARITAASQPRVVRTTISIRELKLLPPGRDG